jgi:hypothetical protein
MDATLAGWCAIAAGVVMIVSGLFLAAFFATGRDALGRLNDATSVIFALLLIPAVLAVGDVLGSIGAWSTLTVVLGLIGVGLVAVTSLLTAAGKLTVRQLTIWQGGSFAILMAWVILASVVGLAAGLLPSGLCLVGVAAGILTAIAAISIGLEFGVSAWRSLRHVDRRLVPILATSAQPWPCRSGASGSASRSSRWRDGRGSCFARKPVRSVSGASTASVEPTLPSSAWARVRGVAVAVRSRVPCRAGARPARGR